MADTGPFSVSEKVLVPHTDKFYEAKILKAQKREDGLWYYLLHYTGWNKKWDEWVEETGLRRAPSASGNAPAAAAAAAAAGSGGGGSGSTAAPPGGGPPPSAAPSKKQAKNGLTVQRQRKAADAGGGGGSAAAAAGAADVVEVQLELEMPAQLKKLLLDQYDAIHEDTKLVPLPRRPNVAQLFQQYIAYVKNKQAESQAEEDICMGLQVYFDKALYQCLLYRAERHQAEQAMNAGQAPSSVYGAEHLLRLFVKLPELLPHTGAPEEQLQLLLKRLDDLMAFMQHQSAKIFLPASDYIMAPPAAVRQQGVPVAGLQSTRV